MLEVKDLNVHYKTPTGTVYAVAGLNFGLDSGKTLGIVGESGSGKTQAMLAIMGLLPKNAIISGSVTYKGKSILSLSVKELNKIRGNEISMIFQDHMTSLNPFITIEKQMVEVLEVHKNINGKEAKNKSIEMLETLRISDASNKINCYPHEFSGGMRQRVMIALALLSEPKILIADEPTTALDVTIQAQILNLLKEIRLKVNTSIILITHDLGVIAGISDNVLVMYGGQSMEYSEVNSLYHNPTHPYTIGLLNAVSRIDKTDEKLIGIPGYPRSKYQELNCCPFNDRCSFVKDICRSKQPVMQLFNKSDVHKRACFVEYEKIKANMKSKS